MLQNHHYGVLIQVGALSNKLCARLVCSVKILGRVGCGEVICPPVNVFNTKRLNRMYTYIEMELKLIMP